MQIQSFPFGALLIIVFKKKDQWEGDGLPDLRIYMHMFMKKANMTIKFNKNILFFLASDQGEKGTLSLTLVPLGKMAHRRVFSKTAASSTVVLFFFFF